MGKLRRVPTRRGWVGEHFAVRIARDLDNHTMPPVVFDHLHDAGLLDMRVVYRVRKNKVHAVRYFPLWQIRRVDRIMDGLRKLYLKGLITEPLARKLLFKVKYNAVKEG